ncbi:MAG: Rv2993c-like domain-containing protein, partial [Streptosporangiaceae bacterium]
MRIARFSRDDDVAYGVIQEVSPDGTGVAAPGPDGDRALIAELRGHPFGVGSDSVRFTGASYPLADVRLLAPVLPTKVVAIGKNYADHAREMGGEPPDEPVIFLKPSTSV